MSNDHPTVDPKEGVSPQNERLDFPDKLSMYITGLKTGDPALVEKMIEDQKSIRTKYGLPNMDSINDPAEYERTLRGIAKSLGVSIRSRSECGNFFEKYSYAGGAHFDEERKVGVDILKDSLQNYSTSVKRLEHELVHALQHKHSPRMPIELMEYEAYVACGKNEILRGNPEIVAAVFDTLIGTSVRHWYFEQAEKRGEKISPSWM